MVNNNLDVETENGSKDNLLVPFRITHAKNLNYTFFKGEPSIGWIGAEFQIETEGGSGNIHWRVETLVSEISITATDDASAYIIIKEDPRREVFISATDNLTGKSDTYSFYIRDFVRSDRQKHSFKDIQADYIKYMLPVVIYEKLFIQWGNLQSYVAWSASVDETYWTNEQVRIIDNESEVDNDDDDGPTTYKPKYTVFDVRTGIKSTSKTSNKIKKYFMYQLPQ